jgi:hypothetical protein
MKQFGNTSVRKRKKGKARAVAINVMGLYIVFDSCSVLQNYELHGAG